MKDWELKMDNVGETILKEPAVILDEMKKLDNESETILNSVRELIWVRIGKL